MGHPDYNGKPGSMDPSLRKIPAALVRLDYGDNNDDDDDLLQLLMC